MSTQTELDPRPILITLNALSYPAVYIICVFPNSLDVRCPSSLEHGFLAGFINSKLVERIYALGIRSLDGLDVRLRRTRLRQSLLDMRSKRYDLGIAAEDPLAECIGGQGNVVDMTCSPNDDSIVLGREREGWVGAHRCGDDRQVVCEAVPNVPNCASLEISERTSVHCAHKYTPIILEHQSLLVAHAAHKCKRSAVARELRTGRTSRESIHESGRPLRGEVDGEYGVYALVHIWQLARQSK